MSFSGSSGVASENFKYDGKTELPQHEYLRRKKFEELPKYSGNMKNCDDAEIEQWVLSVFSADMRKDKSKVSGAVAILKLIMPMFNMAKYGFNPQNWKFMGRYMVKIFCTDVEMENDHVPEFLLWLFKNLYGFRGPRPLFDNR